MAATLPPVDPQVVRPVHAVVHVAAGERVPIDGIVRTGAVRRNRPLARHRRKQRAVDGQGPGAMPLKPARINLTGPLEIRSLETVQAESFLAEVIGHDGGRRKRQGSGFVRIADRAAASTIRRPFTCSRWSPPLHRLAHCHRRRVAGIRLYCNRRTHHHLSRAHSALPFPSSTLSAAGRLFERGILIKDGGSAFERLRCEIDTVVFDKTGHADQRPRSRVVETSANGTHQACRLAQCACQGIPSSGRPGRRQVISNSDTPSAGRQALSG